MVATAATIIILIFGFSYLAEQTRQQGFNFGNELAQIQDDVKLLQTDFNSKLTQWDEGDLDTQEILSYAKSHIQKLNKIIDRYDTLMPPTQFTASVELFKISTSTQLQSDQHYIEWIKTGHKSDKIRSDSLLQESFDYEILALGEFNKAKTGYTEYQEPAKFEPPDTDITSKVNKIWNNMKERCQDIVDIQEIDTCMEHADMWRAEHLP